MDQADIDRFADDFFAAVETKQLDAVLAFFSPDIRVWHASLDQDKDITGSAEVLRQFFAATGRIHYEIVRRFYAEDGFVQQHRIRGEMADGSETNVPVSFVCQFDENGKIARLEEYFNPEASVLRKHSGEPISG